MFWAAWYLSQLLDLPLMCEISCRQYINEVGVGDQGSRVGLFTKAGFVSWFSPASVVYWPWSRLILDKSNRQKKKKKKRIDKSKAPSSWINAKRDYFWLILKSSVSQKSAFLVTQGLGLTVSVSTELPQSPRPREDKWGNCILALEVVTWKTHV